ncbi:unnamed protein product, partial [Polarella glacialis]
VLVSQHGEVMLGAETGSRTKPRSLSPLGAKCRQQLTLPSPRAHSQAHGILNSARERRRGNNNSSNNSNNDNNNNNNSNSSNSNNNNKDSNNRLAKAGLASLLTRGGLLVHLPE